MITWIILGVVAYIAIGIFTGIEFLIERGKDITNRWNGNIDASAFDMEDELMTVAIILLWPGIWLVLAVSKFIVSIEKYIVVPAVNKKNEKEK